MEKKTVGMIAAALLAALSGGAEVLSLGERLEALEALHPELGAPEAPEAKAEEPGKSAEPAPGPTDPAPGEEHLKLDESGEWVPVEEATEAEG